MSSTKLIRHGMDRVAPIPPGHIKGPITDVHLIKALLVAKLGEEAQEVAQARTREELLRELGDCYEVVHSLATMHGFTMPQVIDAASDKADERGPLLMAQDGNPRRPIAILQRRVEIP